jgi:hypothetical protein
MGDMESQAKFYAAMVQNSLWTPNEVRRKQKKNKIDGGDQLFIQQNMAPTAALEEILKSKVNGNQETEIQEGQTDTSTEPSTSE